MRNDVHNSQHRIEMAIAHIQRDPSISEKNKKAIFDFHNYAIAQGLSLNRVLRYLYDVKTLNKFLKKDFELTTKEDIERVLTDLEKSHYGEFTKHGFRIVIRIFYKICSSLQVTKETAWLILMDLEAQDRIEIVRNNGIRIR